MLNPGFISRLRPDLASYRNPGTCHTLSVEPVSRGLNRLSSRNKKGGPSAMRLQLSNPEVNRNGSMKILCVLILAILAGCGSAPSAPPAAAQPAANNDADLEKVLADAN